jgi:hypothetical protein
MPDRGAIVELGFRQERAEAQKSGWSRMNFHGALTRCSIDFGLESSFILAYQVCAAIEIAV